MATKARTKRATSFVQCTLCWAASWSGKCLQAVGEVGEWFFVAQKDSVWHIGALGGGVPSVMVLNFFSPYAGALTTRHEVAMSRVSARVPKKCVGRIFGTRA